jgi:hypothetical protein
MCLPFAFVSQTQGIAMLHPGEREQQSLCRWFANQRAKS